MTRPLFVLLFTMLSISFLVPGAIAEQVTRPDRESSYPDEVANVTQSPWRPKAGEDVAVTLTLKDDARPPEKVSLLFCRVEPEYVCGIPFFMDPAADGRTWTGVLQWDDRFMEDETVHVGYNLTLRYLDRDTGLVERVGAPTGNYWVPSTYPADSDGTYFFYSYTRSDNGDAAGITYLPFIAALVLIFLAARRRGGAHGAR